MVLHFEVGERGWLATMRRVKRASSNNIVRHTLGKTGIINKNTTHRYPDCNTMATSHDLGGIFHTRTSILPWP